MNNLELPTVFITLPIYNEENDLPPLFKDIQSIMEKQPHPYKIIAVNDGSTDATREILNQWSNHIPIHTITHKINRGLGETIRDAFEYIAETAKSQDIIIRMDADNTHKPSYIPEFIKKINQGYDIVIASRFQEGGGMQGVSAYRSFISHCASFIMKHAFPIKGVRDYSCGFRAYTVRIVQQAVSLFGNHFIDLKGMGFTGTVEKLIKFRMLKTKMTEIPFILRYDKKRGTSKMVASITTLGYCMLIVKYIYPWNKQDKKWRRIIKETANG